MLVADIRRHGVRESIVLLDNKILDGVHRYEAAKLAGKQFKVRQFDPKREGDPAAFVTSKNGYRRHLTPEEKRELLAKSIKADPRKSDRQHAAAVGADNKTATRVRRDLERREEIPHVSSSQDSIGRSQSVTRRKRATKVKPGPKPAAANRDTLTKIEDVVMLYYTGAIVGDEFIDRLRGLLPNLAKRIAEHEEQATNGRNREYDRSNSDDERLDISDGFPRPHYFDQLSPDRQHAQISEWKALYRS
jgi:hypothetical protein